MRQKKELGMVLIFLGLFLGYALLEASQRGLAATFANPVFLGQANLLNLTRSIGLFGIFSVAMGTVIITGGIDLSVGSMFALLGVILAYFLGPDNKLVVTSAYVLCASLTWISAILIGFYTNSISPASHGSFFELYAVAACVLGGCSLRGGEGSILGIFIGTAMIQLLRNIVNLQGIDSSLEFVVMGGVIMIAVSLDQVLGARRRAREARVDVKGAPAEPAPAAKH